MPVIPSESKRLKLFRKTFKITQQHIANTIGKTRQLISQYEKGIVPMPDCQNPFKLCTEASIYKVKRDEYGRPLKHKKDYKNLVKVRFTLSI